MTVSYWQLRISLDNQAQTGYALNTHKKAFDACKNSKIGKQLGASDQ